MTETPLERVLRRASARVVRLSPGDASRAQAGGALIVDVRAHEDRARTGVVPGSIHIPRTVLEWRLDPGGAWRTPHITVGQRLVLVCSDGCSSLLAAESLLELGLDATDVVGGSARGARPGFPSCLPFRRLPAPDRERGRRSRPDERRRPVRTCRTRSRR